MNHVDLPTNPTVLSLCAGIGGLDLGIGLAFPGARTICFVEREAAACEILVSRMEEGRLDHAPIWTDVKTFDGRPWRGVSILCAGYPCQPFSTAGKRQGDKDPRHLWPDIRRIIDECGRPTYLVLENVQGHVSKGLREVLEDLMELGYGCEWGVYSAAQAGATHRRNRVFILAHTECPSVTGRGEPGDLAGSERAAQAEGLQRERGGDAAGDCESHVDDPNDQGPQGWDQPITQSPNERPAWPPGPEGDWSDVPEELWPATEPAIRGMADGVPVRVDQLRALGNAVVPQQAALAIRELWGRLSNHNPVN